MQIIKLQAAQCLPQFLIQQIVIVKAVKAAITQDAQFSRELRAVRWSSFIYSWVCGDDLGHSCIQSVIRGFWVLQMMQLFNTFECLL